MSSESSTPSMAPESHRYRYLGATIDDRYVVESVLGEGGMGVVYLARRTVIDRKVAIKVLHSELMHDQEATARFITEAKAASAIGSRHIVDVLDFGTMPDGSTYFVMEYLEGQSLMDLVEAEGALQEARVVGLARQIAEGLAAAHDAGIVHRDLKPDNVFLVAQRRGDLIKIVDFGIAKMAKIQSKVTRAGKVFGTPHYMSPEQCRGTALDHRTDLYSLGCMLYELLSGVVPFDADEPMAVLTMQVYDDPEDIAVKTRADTDEPACSSEGMAAIVMKLLAKEPEDRYGDAHELIADLERLEGGELTIAESLRPPPIVPLEEGADEVLELIPRAPSAPDLSDIPGGATLMERTSNVPGAKGRIVLPDPTPRQRGVSREQALLVGAVTLVAGLVLAFLVVRPLLTRGPVAATPAPESSGAPSEAQATDPSSSAASAASAAPSTKAGPARGTQVTVLVYPFNAKLYRDKQSLGSSPVTVTVAPGEEVKLWARYINYWPAPIVLDGTKTKIKVRMAPKTAGSKSATVEDLSGAPAGSSAPATGEDREGGDTDGPPPDGPPPGGTQPTPPSPDGDAPGPDDGAPAESPAPAPTPAPPGGDDDDGVVPKPPQLPAAPE